MQTSAFWNPCIQVGYSDSHSCLCERTLRQCPGPARVQIWTLLVDELRQASKSLKQAQWAISVVGWARFNVPLDTVYVISETMFLQVRWPNQQCQSTEGGWLVIQIALNLTRSSHHVTIIQCQQYQWQSIIWWFVYKYCCSFFVHLKVTQSQHI